MKKKPTLTAPPSSCPSDTCADCSHCTLADANETRPAKVESRALYGAEVLTYYFYFYHHLVSGKQHYSPHS